MKILAVASEIFPLIKTGGLADVTGALPLALGEHGVSVTSFLPGYPEVLRKLDKPKKCATFKSVLGVKADVLSATHRGLELLIFDAPELFDRQYGPYGDKTGADYPDNWRRFGAFAKAAAEVALGAIPGYAPDIVHAHDWQAAMTPAYLRYAGKPAPASVMTIHNIAFQGRFAASVFGELELPATAYTLDGVEYYNGVGFFKAGLQAAAAITTVSPTYAREIRTPEFGMGLEGLMNARSGDLHGIVNGIDTGVWNPRSDADLTATYHLRALGRRSANRRAVENRFELTHDAAPLFSVISRLTWQKGMDILGACIDGLVAQGGKLAVLGSGDKALEGAMLAATARHRGRIGIVTGYDEPLSHLMQGGADAIVIPSRFEPCGLTQLCAMRYGCIPVVSRTGGLADTVIDANAAALDAGVATGVQFSPLNAAELAHAMTRTIALHGNRNIWTAMQRRAMKSDVSWSASAARYAALYRSLSQRR